MYHKSDISNQCRKDGFFPLYGSSYKYTPTCARTTVKPSEKKYVGFLLYNLYQNKFQIDQRFKCKNWNPSARRKDTILNILWVGETFQSHEEAVKGRTDNHIKIENVCMHKGKTIKPKHRSIGCGVRRPGKSVFQFSYISSKLLPFKVLGKISIVP